MKDLADRGWGGWSPPLPEGDPAWEMASVEQHLLDRPYAHATEMEPELGALKRWFPLGSGPILELACGAGRLPIALAEAGWEAVGVDGNPRFVDRARQEALRRGLERQARFVCADIRHLQLDQAFPVILLIDQSFKCMLTPEDQLGCLRSIRRHLAPEGRCLLEYRCVFKFPDAGPGEPYTFTDLEGTWQAVDLYDPVTQVSTSVIRPAGTPEARPRLDSCRLATWGEFDLLCRVAELRIEHVDHDFEERGPGALYLDALVALRAE